MPQPHPTTRAAMPGRRSCGLRHRALAQECKGRQRRQAEHDGDDQHRPRHEVFGPEPWPRAHITYTEADAQASPGRRGSRSSSPSRTRCPSASGRAISGRNAPISETPIMEEKVRDDDHRSRCDRDVAATRQRQRRRRQHAADRRQPQQPLLARAQIGIGADQSASRASPGRSKRRAYRSSQRGPVWRPSATTLTK